MTTSPELAGRQFVKRCNGAEPGELLDQAHAEAALKRATESGFEISGSLLRGSASWRNESRDLTFTLSEVTEDAADVRRRTWGAL